METARAIRSSMLTTDTGRRSRGNSNSTATSSRLRAPSGSERDQASSSSTGGQHRDRRVASTSASEAVSRSSHSHNPMVKVESVDNTLQQEPGHGSSHRDRVGSTSEAGLKVVNPRAGDCLTQGSAYTIEVSLPRVVMLCQYLLLNCASQALLTCMHVL
jgi:hypothetical protein